MKPVNNTIDIASLSAIVGITALAGLLLFNIHETGQAAVADMQASNAAKMAAGNVRPASRLVGKAVWSQLSAAQQKTLSPLLSQWGKLDDKNKAKWITIADRYPGLKPEEQKRIQKRMELWAQLSPEQKQIARLNYAQAKKIETAQKTRQWELYQQLPAEKKQLLASGVPLQLANVPAPKTLADTITAASTENVAASVTEQSSASASQSADLEVTASPSSRGDLPVVK
ncbi:DUF3106 domain-containing protein [Undibacterium sp. Ji42W]|uniref:DUF3106 domain-containing protein n=1 Tax=Undibacterium sp. Ji42W TaxID=3413039 RepID=UPI003BF2E786